MATKSMYFYKVTLVNSASDKELPIDRMREEINKILDKNMNNDAIDLTLDTAEPIIMDVLARNGEYLFARLSKKKQSNSVQKRDYSTLKNSPVLTPVEEQSHGIELFAYCILGYSHGILSLAKAQGAPQENALDRLFSIFNSNYKLQIDDIPNAQLIDELYNGKTPEINGITIEIPTPTAEVLKNLFQVDDKQILNSIYENTQSIVICAKPEFRDSILSGKNKVRTFIDNMLNKKEFKKIIIDAKPTPGVKKKEYDLYEKYFKYPFEIKENHTVNRKKVEYTRDEMKQQYFEIMSKIYRDYKEVIIGICGRGKKMRS